MTQSEKKFYYYNGENYCSQCDYHIDWFDKDCCMRCVYGVDSVLFEMHEKSREFRNESENDSDNETDNKSDLDMTQHNRSTIIVEKDVQYEDEGWTSE